MGKSLCKECTPIVEAEQEQQRIADIRRDREAREEQVRRKREREEQQQQERQARWNAYLESEFARIEELLDKGVTPYLYDEILINSQSYFTDQEKVGFWAPRIDQTTNTVGEQADLGDLQTLGLQGWEVIATIPVTFGAVLTNHVGSNLAYAGGYGGMVIGARLLLRLPVTATTLENSRATIETVLARTFPG